MNTGVSALRRKLIRWYQSTRRELPWRATGDPYRIWVSEIMLQQTRVSAVVPYYERFLRRFPDVASLARAPEDAVLAAWGGLGYYNRARNLRKAARQMLEQGGFPHEFASIRRLPGVGDYTAAAIASIAFNLPHAALDGNVVRVLSRLTAEREHSGAAAVRERLAKTAAALLDRRRPGIFNQAMMEIGATVCLPARPLCASCPISEWCEARRLGMERLLPVKCPRPKPVVVDKTLLLVEENGSLLLRRRDGGQKLRGFWEFPEADELPRARLGDHLGEFRHSILNHRYLFTLVSARISLVPDGFQWVLRKRLSRIPLSTVAKKALAHSLM